MQDEMQSTIPIIGVGQLNLVMDRTINCGPRLLKLEVVREHGIQLFNNVKFLKAALQLFVKRHGMSVLDDKQEANHYRMRVTT